MKILALDTAGSQCDVCVFDAASNRVLAQFNSQIGNKPDGGHAERLMGSIADVLEQAGINYFDLGAIAATRGPGCFTGIRVGLATARGFALGLDIPCIGIASLEALFDFSFGSETRQERPCGVILAAGRGQSYCLLDFVIEAYPTHTPFVAENEKIAGALLKQTLPLVLCGNGASHIYDLLRQMDTSGSDKLELLVKHELAHAPIEHIAQMAADRLKNNDPGKANHSPEPLYLRRPDAKPQKNILNR